MAKITKLVRPSQPQHFESDVALSLMQAFHRHLDLAALLELLFGQTQSLVHATGLSYLFEEKDMALSFGRTSGHSLSYRLNLGETPLGEVKFFSKQRFNKIEIETVEDLTSLVVSALNNALLFAAARVHAPKPRTSSEAPGKDALIMVSIDGFEKIREDQGETWAQTLLDAVTSQVQEGLREADNVYQIDKTHLAVLLPRTDNRAALEVAEKLRILIAALHLADGAISHQLTACMGVASSANADSPERVVKLAKQALKEAQILGNNQVRSAIPNS